MPIIEPVDTCVVDTGTPQFEANSTKKLVTRFADNPCPSFMSLTLFEMVSATFAALISAFLAYQSWNYNKYLTSAALSLEDINDAKAHGLLAIDCSWKNAEEVFLIVKKRKMTHARALPYLVATLIFVALLQKKRCFQQQQTHLISYLYGENQKNTLNNAECKNKALQ